ncbi:hypothetical protein TcasGA2_TC034916 [Tribolium castaneum]|uniref:Ubiquitin-like domain-containing protein n=1 Tax=Tribolium castaneum TaxID=7070 RepID=A0A139WAI0_TRICA|nr:hypothetical protein TcasGA2_TC034916 [Tribolium castaneum]
MELPERLIYRGKIIKDEAPLSTSTRTNLSGQQWRQLRHLTQRDTCGSPRPAPAPRLVVGWDKGTWLPWGAKARHRIGDKCALISRQVPIWDCLVTHMSKVWSSEYDARNSPLGEGKSLFLSSSELLETYLKHCSDHSMELHEVPSTSVSPYRCYVRGKNHQSEGPNVHTIGSR